MHILLQFITTPPPYSTLVFWGTARGAIDKTNLFYYKEHTGSQKQINPKTLCILRHSSLHSSFKWRVTNVMLQKSKHQHTSELLLYHLNILHLQKQQRLNHHIIHMTFFAYDLLSSVKHRIRCFKDFSLCSFCYN